MSQLESLKNLLFGTRARLDLWWVLLWCICVYSLAQEINFFERLHDFTRRHEEIELDELFTVLLCLPIAGLIYILRRNKEMRCEIELRCQAEEAVRRQAHYDALTGLPNRNLLEDRLAQAIARARRSRSKLAVFFIDLDGFKSVNDTYGHAAGDTLLREIAERLQRYVRAHDTAARLGGDEFIVLLDAVDTLAEIEQVAQRLIAGISMPWSGFGPELAVSASIGIAVFSGIESCAEEHLMRHADQAMYEAKAAGKNQYKFFAELPVEEVLNKPWYGQSGQQANL
jgi:diguanylate cyclase (GGDEF)-like protein